ncbi:CHAT domain-containing protein [Desulfamplus magnetovallimortis]|nr:CHAT domain-containing protein [Desulfamplus magnetovallimortis]
MKSIKSFGITVIFSILFACYVNGADLNTHLNAANQHLKKGDSSAAIAEFETVVDILKKSKNPAGAQQVQMNIGILYFQEGQFSKAVQELESALSLNKKPSKALDIKLNKTLASAHYKMGHYAIRASILESLLEKYKEIDLKTKADILAELADSYRRNEIYSKAIDCYAKALKCYKELKNTTSEAIVLTAMGLSQAKLGEFDAAIGSLEKALPIAEKTGKAQNISEIYSNLGIVYWDSGEYSKALDYFTKAKDLEKKEELKANLSADYNNEGLVYKSAGNYPKALDSIETSIEIAREIKDEKSEAIALSNHALVNRILGKNDDAMDDYQSALEIYSRVQFKEGTASCYLGLGKLYEVDSLDYPKAYEYYEKALNIYRELGNIAYQAETLNQIGRVLKKGIDRKRTTRDLIFEDDGPVFIDMEPDEAKTASLKAYGEALELAEKVGKKEAIWSAQQGIGYALKTQGKENEAFKYYNDAIETVISIRGSDSDSELMGDYLKDKEDLFTEAIEVASILYAKTNEKKYLSSQMEYQEIYKNEVMKNAIMTAKPLFQEPEKAEIFTSLTKALAEKKKVDEASSQLMSGILKKKEPNTESEKAEYVKKKKAVEEEFKRLSAKSQKLEVAFTKLLDKWKKQYPNDAGMFESAAKVDLQTIQKSLNDDQALIQYFPLSDMLSIICVTNKEIKAANVNITYEDLAKLIRDDYTYKQIELFGHGECDDEEQCYTECIQVMQRLHQALINPVEKEIAGKENLIIVPSKYLSYVPFSALVKGVTENGEPEFLVYNKNISYLRLSFFDNYKSNKGKTSVLQNPKTICVANPDHKFLKTALAELPGTEKEVEGVKKAIESKKLIAPDILSRKTATEDNWKEMISKGDYSVYYFATHGVPFAEILQDSRKIEKYVDKLSKKMGDEKDEIKIDKYKKKIDKYSPFVRFCKETFNTKSPLYGFLYMTYTGKEKNDGVLTLKEIMELPDSSFKNAKLAVLSACNTAVTYSPKIDQKTRQELQEGDINKELVKSGWTPGVDQVCLTDTFMKRNFQSVLGTLWFADDAAMGFIGSRFFDGLDQFSPSESLRQAQIAYLKAPPFGSDYTKAPKHPYFWAVGAVFGQ